MASKIQLRRGTAAQATAANPILSLGEVGFETDTRYIKIGDGTTAWNALPYVTLPDIALKAPIASPAFTGTPTGITKAHVGLGNVDNTSDANKPVSTAQQTALNGKAASVHTHSIADITDYVAPPARALTKNNVTASYTLVAADAIDIVLHATAAAGITVTAPQDTAATIAQEISIPWRQYGTGQITFAAGTGATLISRGSVFKSAGQYAEGLLTKVAANTWLLSGDIVP